MNKMKKNFNFKRVKIKHQMYLLYILVLFVPILLVGNFLMKNISEVLNQYYSDLLAADNQRMKTLIMEVTTNTYNLSQEICFDSSLKNMLKTDYESKKEFMDAVNADSKLDTMLYLNTDVESITIYTDNPSVFQYKQFKQITEKEKNQEWFMKAVSQPAAFWTGIVEDKNNVTKGYSIALARKMLLPDDKYSVVIVIRLSSDYLRTRMDSNIIDALSLDDGNVIFSSKRDWYGKPQKVEIDYQDNYYSYAGPVLDEGKKYFANLSTCHLYMTNSKMYLSALDDKAFDSIDDILAICRWIILAAIVIPAVILIIFTNYFTDRIKLLRETMHRASTEDYEIERDIKGHDELTETFDDLRIMIDLIKEKEARMYQKALDEKEFKNKQQLMEYKMLASQINPHFLYNSLETIRMKALTMGDKEVSNAIKVLGKTLRYVLENTGTTCTTLRKELNHIENYVTIQKLRFNDRVNYHLSIQEGLNLDNIMILPLLLQPIVENAVVHGLEGVERDGQIEVKVLLEQKDTLKIIVKDNGKGMTMEELQDLQKKLQTPNLNLQSSIGLYNISQRITLYYGEQYGMVFNSQEGEGTEVVLRLPVIPGEEERL